MADDLVDPELELDEDEALSEGARWTRQPYTAKFTKVQAEQARTDLETLINAAMASTDGKVAYAAGRLTQTMAICSFLAQAAYGDGARCDFALKTVKPKPRTAPP